VVLNKVDLCPDFAARIAEVESVAPDVTSIPLSALDSVGPLRVHIEGRTVVLLGSSGAGKSTIVNGLLGESHQSTQSVRESDSRGRHTTTSRMLFPLPGGGALIDTPGLRELALWAGEEALDEAFSDIAAVAAGVPV
jgi:ribosome biogenesis GTPase